MNHRYDLPVLLLYNLDRTWSADEKEEILGLVRCLVAGLSAVGHPILPVRLEDEDLEGIMAAFDPAEFLVFNWCEEIPGTPHSAGLVAQKLEKLGFIFTGTNSRVLQRSYDKPTVKRQLARRGVPIPCWQVYETVTDSGWDCFPAIVKPAYEHSSFGITHEAVIHDPEELSQQVAWVIDTFQQPVLVEDFIDGREFHVTVVGNGRLQALPIAEMDFSAIDEDSGRLCTYDSKFVPGSSDYQMIQLRLPADLTELEEQQLEETAIAAYRATGCRDYARLDIRHRDGVFHVLDVNPNADISPDTSVVLSAELAGYSYGQFGSLLINLAARRHPVFSRRKAEHQQQVIPVLGAIS